ncbi:MAG: Heat shock protein [Chlamydiales bacterium]|jgi:heat shock protein HtpX|nr:Heat shock protein [Chlamydiales bacterium]
MAFLKRIGLFLAINALIVLTLSLVLNLLNVQPYLTKSGIDYRQLIAFCLVWGMGGALISLALSRIMAKWMMSITLIDPATSNPAEKRVIDSVYRLCQKAGLSTMPEVGIYDSPEVNAFATGPTKDRSLVAVSSGLLERMDADEVDGVLAHEVSHIANGDMVTMTLLQGVINAFVMFLARIIAFAIMKATKKEDEEETEVTNSIAYVMTVFALEIVFMALGSLVTAAFSRYREYRADAGGAFLAGKQPMVKALQKLQQVVELQQTEPEKSSVQALKISSPQGYLRFFATHPPLESRIERLKNLPF